MIVDEYKKLHLELLQKNATTKVLTLNGVREVFLIYPHVWALADPCRRHEHSNRTTNRGQSREWQGPPPKLGFVRRN
jgi:hypothetical protein